MKKIAMLFVLLFVLSSFTLKVENDGYFTIKHEIFNVNGMNYLVLYNKYRNTTNGISTSVAVVNITKDRLEVEKLKLEIEELKRK